MPFAHLQEILIRARSSEADNRQIAARELADQALSESVRSTLLELIGDPDWRVRRVAVDSILNSNKNEFIPDLVNCLYDEANAGKRNSAMDVLARCGSEILPYLTSHLTTNNADVRMFLVNLLGDLRESTHLSFITECLHDPEDNVVAAAIGALGKIGHPSSVPHLVELLNGDNLWHQFQAIEAASDMQDEALLPHLIPLLASPYCRTTVLKALGKFHHPSAYRALVEALIRDDQIDHDSLDSLRRILKAPQPEMIRRQDRAMIRNLYAEILKNDELENLERELEYEEKLDESRPNTNDPIPSVTACLQAVKDADPIVRRKALQDMATNQSPEFREPLMAALADEDSRAREIAAAALKGYRSPEVTDALLCSLQDEQIWVRVAVYFSLEASDPRVMEILIHNIQHENPICQAAILRALGGSRDARAAEIVMSYLKNEDPEIRASACEGLGSFHFEPVQERLIELLENDRSWNVRLEALRSLKQIQPPRFQQTLVDRLYKDDDPSVRKEILCFLRDLRIIDPPDIVFEFVVDLMLADSAAEYLLSCRMKKDQILERVSTSPPAIRRIVKRIFD